MQKMAGPERAGLHTMKMGWFYWPANSLLLLLPGIWTMTALLPCFMHLLHLYQALLLGLYPLAVLLVREDLAQLLVLFHAGFFALLPELFALLLAELLELGAFGALSHLATGARTAGTWTEASVAHAATAQEQRVGFALLDLFEVDFVNLLVLLVAEGKQAVHTVGHLMRDLLFGEFLMLVVAATAGPAAIRALVTDGICLLGEIVLLLGLREEAEAAKREGK